jgi:hypothetical protein
LSDGTETIPYRQQGSGFKVSLEVRTLILVSSFLFPLYPVIYNYFLATMFREQLEIKYIVAIFTLP